MGLGTDGLVDLRGGGESGLLVFPTALLSFDKLLIMTAFRILVHVERDGEKKGTKFLLRGVELRQWDNRIGEAVELPDLLCNDTARQSNTQSILATAGRSKDCGGLCSVHLISTNILGDLDISLPLLSSWLATYLGV